MKIHLSPGERRKVFSRSFSSVPMDYEFEAKALHEGEKIEGTVEVQGSQWIFPKAPQRQVLQEKNTVHAGVWDTFFRVYVTSKVALELSVPKRRLSSLRWLIAIALIIVLAVLFVFVIRI